MRALKIVGIAALAVLPLAATVFAQHTPETAMSLPLNGASSGAMEGTNNM